VNGLDVTENGDGRVKRAAGARDGGDAGTAELDAALADADAALIHSFAFGAIVAARRRKIPYVVISPFNAIPTRALSAGLPQIPLVTPWLSRVAFAYVLDRAWAVGDVGFARYLRAHAVEMPRRPMWREQLRDGIAHLHLFSEHVVPRPRDWPACGEVTGFCFLDAPAGWRPSEALRRFVEATPQPVYVGFGSMTGMEPEKLATLTRDALRRAGQRAVIGMGWGGIRGFEPSDDVLVVDDVPHDWLFPRVAAVVHHCGAGTTAAALRAGRASVPVPFFADQTFWAQTLNDLGAAPPPLPKRKLTVERLAAAISRATTEPQYTERAEAIGAAIRAEDGAARTADRVLHHLARA